MQLVKKLHSAIMGVAFKAIVFHLILPIKGDYFVLPSLSQMFPVDQMYICKKIIKLILFHAQHQHVIT